MVEVLVTDMPAGRPTLYDPAYCDQVIELGKQGKSITAMAAIIGVNKDSLYEWAATHEAFSDALTRARQLSQLWWEDAGQNSLFIPGFQASVWSRSMAARFPDEWRESSKTEITGKDGGPLGVLLQQIGRSSLPVAKNAEDE